MSRTPHSRTRPPAPKEQPASLAVGGSPLAPPTTSGPLTSPSTKWAVSGDTFGPLMFIVLIVLGLAAAVYAFWTI